MKEIGEFLKQKRLEKGLTIDQLVDKTRMPAKRIKAIEEGDMTAFKDDITYLQFFIQSYCNAVGIPFSEVKKQLNDSINSYTTSFEKEQIRQHIESEQNIREMSEKRIKEYKKKNPQKKVRKIDFSLISFVSVISLILICVLTVGGYYLTRHFMQPEPPQIAEPPISNENDNKPNPDQPQPVEPEIKEVEVRKEDATHYVIENVKDKVVLRIEFSANSWFQATLDGKVMSTPKVQVYDAGETIEIELDADKNKELEMRFGFIKGIKIYVNEKETALDESIASGANARNIVFKIGENANELAQ